MNRQCLAISAASLATVLAGATASANEFPADGTIVVSDNWCAPDGDCNSCNQGRRIRSAKCNNSYCDNMVFQCASPPFVSGQQTTLDTSTLVANVSNPLKNYGWTSDEQGEMSTNAVCPFGWAMVGMVSSGSYSDNIRTRCQLVNRPGGWDGITLIQNRIGFYSDEFPYNVTHEPQALWFSGASCTGSYCDNMWWWSVSQQ